VQRQHFFNSLYLPGCSYALRDNGAFSCLLQLVAERIAVINKFSKTSSLALARGREVNDKKKRHEKEKEEER